LEADDHLAMIISPRMTPRYDYTIVGVITFVMF
jgi:hypothetical protein